MDGWTRGPKDAWVDSQCENCGNVYFDCGISQAQALHDRDEDCDGRLLELDESGDPICRDTKKQAMRDTANRKDSQVEK